MRAEMCHHSNTVLSQADCTFTANVHCSSVHARVVMVTTASQLACVITVTHTLVTQLDTAITVMQISSSWNVHVYHHSNTLCICIYLLPMFHFVPLLRLPVHHHLNENTKYLDSDQPDTWS
jgi:hypothetical protein